MLHVEVTQNNPIVLSFIELLSRGATNRHEVSHSLSKTALHEAEVGELTTMEGRFTKTHVIYHAMFVFWGISYFEAALWKGGLYSSWNLAPVKAAQV